MVIILLIKMLVDLQNPKLPDCTWPSGHHCPFLTLSFVLTKPELGFSPSYRSLSSACPKGLASTEKWNLSSLVSPGKSADHSKTLFLSTPTGHLPLPAQARLLYTMEEKVFPFDFETQMSERGVFSQLHLSFFLLKISLILVWISFYLTYFLYSKC